MSYYSIQVNGIYNLDETAHLFNYLSALCPHIYKAELVTEDHKPKGYAYVHFYTYLNSVKAHKTLTKNPKIEGIAAELTCFLFGSDFHMIVDTPNNIKSEKAMKSRRTWTSEEVTSNFLSAISTSDGSNFGTKFGPLFEQEEVTGFNLESRQYLVNLLKLMEKEIDTDARAIILYEFCKLDLDYHTIFTSDSLTIRLLAPYNVNERWTKCETASKAIERQETFVLPTKTWIPFIIEFKTDSEEVMLECVSYPRRGKIHYLEDRVLDSVKVQCTDKPSETMTITNKGSLSISSKQKHFFLAFDIGDCEPQSFRFGVAGEKLEDVFDFNCITLDNARSKQ